MSGPEYGKTMIATKTPIRGVLLFDLPVHGDNRGWFKENWQREKMMASGLPDFRPIQNNISYNESAGTTRGIHAEPWDKFISVATGSVFGVWVDLREGASFGKVFTAVLDASKAIFVPRGVGNAFQTLTDGTVYTYLVNDHWSADSQIRYVYLNLADPALHILWPIPLDQAELSIKDREHPFLSDLAPMQPRRLLILGANGQLGLALRKIYDGDPTVDFSGRAELDLANSEPFAKTNFAAYHTIINAAAYTSVDLAETPTGRAEAWAVNASAVAVLARKCTAHRITLVHISSDYVFDGTTALHVENEHFSPLGTYGQSKAAGDAAVSTVPTHYIVRTSWLVGEGSNFVSTMASLAERGISPSVVKDQFGRLSFTQDIAAAIWHLLSSSAPHGTYNVSNSGPIQSWADIAADIYEILGLPRQSVLGITTAEYSDGKDLARRPEQSGLDLRKIQATKFMPAPADQRLREFLSERNTGQLA